MSGDGLSLPRASLWAHNSGDASLRNKSSPKDDHGWCSVIVLGRGECFSSPVRPFMACALRGCIPALLGAATDYGLPTLRVLGRCRS